MNAVEVGAIRWVVEVPPPAWRSSVLGPRRVVGQQPLRVRAGAGVGPSTVRRPWPEQVTPPLPLP